jgi:hypothetical protein
MRRGRRRRRRRRRRNVEQEINSMGARVLADVGCATFD